jgi:hypothetical protein
MGGLGARAARTDQRFQLKLPVNYETADGRGRGVTWDISTRDARIEGVSYLARPGTAITLEVLLPPDMIPLELRGQVVRETITGFAVEFVGVHDHVLELLAIVLEELAKRQGDAG